MMNEMKKMKTLTLQGIPFEVVDEAARNDIESVKDTLENLPKNEIVTPDLSQNDSTAPDYVKNRTHWVEEDVVFTFDGNIEGKDAVIVSEFEFGTTTLVKVSDRVFAKEDLSGASVSMSDGVTFTFDEEYIYEVNSNCICVGDSIFSSAVLELPELGITLPSIGTYAMKEATFGNVYYPTEMKAVVVHPIDEKFIPDTVAKKSEVYTQDEVDDKINSERVIINITDNDSSGTSDTSYSNIMSNVNAGRSVVAKVTIRGIDGFFMLPFVSTDGYDAYFSGYVFLNAVYNLYTYRVRGTTVTRVANKVYDLETTSKNSIVISSSESKKQFRITVDDNGTLTATEVT